MVRNRIVRRGRWEALRTRSRRGTISRVCKGQHRGVSEELRPWCGIRAQAKR